MPEPKSASRRFYIAPRENRRSTDATCRLPPLLTPNEGANEGRGMQHVRHRRRRRRRRRPLRRLPRRRSAYATQWLRTDKRRTDGVSVAGSNGQTAAAPPPRRHRRCVDCPLIFFTAVARVACLVRTADRERATASQITDATPPRVALAAVRVKWSQIQKKRRRACFPVASLPTWQPNIMDRGCPS